MNAINTNLIFDVGAHRGEDTDYYLKRGYRVVAVEAEPQHAEFIRSRFPVALARGDLVLVEAAVSSDSRDLVFYRNTSVSVYGTANPKWAQRNIEVGTGVEEITVSGIAASDLFEQFGIPYFVKIDIEGSDILVLEALKGFESRPAYVSIESDSWVFQDIEDQFNLLLELGYLHFKISPQHTVQSQKVPPTSRHGNTCDHVFEEGSSGLFGEDLPGEWISAREALVEFKSIVLLEQMVYAVRKGILNGPLTNFLETFHHVIGWFDTHARHERAEVER